ncbi:aspartic peptidase domain-containing protein [Russula brevipes]|nr:aspartic peptidase domain-containing protein [Russula brevipes]
MPSSLFLFSPFYFLFFFIASGRVSVRALVHLSPLAMASVFICHFEYNRSAHCLSPVSQSLSFTPSSLGSSPPFPSPLPSSPTRALYLLPLDALSRPDRMPRVSPRSSPRSRQKRTPRAVHSELSRRDEGTGGSAGIVLPLNMVGSGMYEAVYAVTVQVGSNKQNFSLQVDTGSSDLWIASTSCSSTSCGGSKGHQYDPSVSGVATTTNFSIEYLVGNVSGPVYWDELHIGGYTISNQAWPLRQPSILSVSIPASPVSLALLFP